MGERRQPLFNLSFNGSVKVASTDERLTSDAGVLLLREADHKLGLTESLAATLSDPRNPEKVRSRAHGIVARTLVCHGAWL